MLPSNVDKATVGSSSGVVTRGLENASDLFGVFRDRSIVANILEFFRLGIGRRLFESLTLHMETIKYLTC